MGLDEKLDREQEISENIDRIRSLNLDLYVKQFLALLITGCKPATQFPLLAKDESLASLSAALQEMNLSFDTYISENMKGLDAKGDPGAAGYLCDVVVAVDEATVKELMKYCDPQVSKEFGSFMGFPDSAVNAFDEDEKAGHLFKDQSGKLLSIKDDVRIQKELGLRGVTGFRLSKAHWKEEVKVLKNWRDTLQKYAPDLLIEE